MKKLQELLSHLTNVPVAIALGFLLVGAPSAPMAKMMPSSGQAMAIVGCGIDWHPPIAPDSDCDGVPDAVDPCPTDPADQCSDAVITAAMCDLADRLEDIGTAALLLGTIATLFSRGAGAPVAIMGAVALVASLSMDRRYDC